MRRNNQYEDADDKYQDDPNYYWADEWGWIDKRTGEVVSPDTRQEDRRER